MRTDVEIVSNSSEVGGSKALDAWREKAWKKGLKRVSRTSWGSGGKGATFSQTQRLGVVISPLFAVTLTNPDVNS